MQQQALVYKQETKLAVDKEEGERNILMELPCTFLMYYLEECTPTEKLVYEALQFIMQNNM